MKTVPNFRRTDAVALLKACGKHKDLQRATRLHADLLRSGLLPKDCYIASTLVNVYVKCGAFENADQVLFELPVRDAVSWSALIAGYAQHGRGEEALKRFEKMQDEGLSPDAITYTCVLKACGSIGATSKGEQLHDLIIRNSLLEKDMILGNALVDMHAKFGALAKAAEVLDELPVRDVVSWNMLLAGLVQHGYDEEVLSCLTRMLCEGIAPNTVAFTLTLKACASMADFSTGEHIHNEILKQGLLGKDLLLGTSLVDMYAKCGALAKSAQVLDELPVRDAVSWGALIAGYSQQGEGEKALNCFELMQREGLFANVVIYVCILKACGSIGAADKGIQIHNEITKQGLLGKDVTLGNILVDMYVKTGTLTKAAQVVFELPVRNLVTWNALIVGYAQEGHGEAVLKCFERMQAEGLSPDITTLTSVLKACGLMGAVDKGEKIHKEISKQGLLGANIVLSTALVDMYIKCGAIAKAAQVLHELPTRDVVSWSALIAGYAQEGQGEEAILSFERMKVEGLSPNIVTFLCILKACSSIGAAGKGKLIHNEIIRQGLFGEDIAIGNTLVDMYAKCDALERAAEVLHQLPVRNIVTWNALIVGYVQSGQGEDALKCFECLQCEGLSPNPVTLLCVLSACSHSGLVMKGKMHFSNMCTKYNITPDVHHHACMVDLFARAGEFKKAFAVIRTMQTLVDLPVWHAFLGACRESGNVMLGQLAFDNAMDIDRNDASSYIMLSKMYVNAGLHGNAVNVEALRLSKTTRELKHLLSQNYIRYGPMRVQTSACP